MKCCSKRLFLLLTCLMFAVGHVAAADTLVEVIDDAGSVAVVSGPGSADISPDSAILTTYTEGYWRRRIGWPTTGYNALQGDWESCPELQLDVTGLGTTDPVHVYARYYGTSNSDWCIAAGLESGELTRYSYNDRTSVVLEEDLLSSIHLMEAYVGKVVDASGGISVYLDDGGAQGIGSDRAAFNGLRFSSTSPFPEGEMLIEVPDDSGVPVDVVYGSGSVSLADPGVVSETHANDDLWGKRLNAPVGWNSWQTYGDESVPLAQLDVNYLEGTDPVDVFIRYAGSKVSPWHIAAGLDSENLSTFKMGDDVSVEVEETSDPNVVVMEALLGQITDPTSGFSIFFDRDDSISERAVFLGARIAPATVPEPSMAFMLIGLCAGGLLLLRREKVTQG